MYHLRCAMVLSCLATLMTSCGQSKTSEGGGGKGPTGSGDPENTQLVGGQGGAWFGAVVKCLVDAEEVRIQLSNGSSGSTIVQKTICSPRISAPSVSELDQKLDAWRQENCPSRIPVRNGTPGQWQGCEMTPFGAPTVTANNAQAVDAKLSDKEFCGSKQGANYGTVSCS